MKTKDNPRLSFKTDVVKNALDSSPRVSFRDLEVTRLSWMPKGGKTLSMKDMLRRQSYRYYSDRTTKFDSNKQNLRQMAEYLFPTQTLAAKGITVTFTNMTGGVVKVDLTKSTDFEVVMELTYLRGIAKGKIIQVYFKPQDEIIESTENLYKVEMNGSVLNGFAVHTIYGSIDISAVVREKFDQPTGGSDNTNDDHWEVKPTTPVIGKKYDLVTATGLQSHLGYSSEHIHFALADGDLQGKVTLVASADTRIGNVYIPVNERGVRVRFAVYDLGHKDDKYSKAKLVALSPILTSTTVDKKYLSHKLRYMLIENHEYRFGLQMFSDRGPLQPPNARFVTAQLNTGSDRIPDDEYDLNISEAQRLNYSLAYYAEIETKKSGVTT
ncbi:hypothetical protein HWC21_gp018 [Vibrio phage VAP7]|uniref:Uncharacterized protein n=1 Tax=Vibrio phage VAP7 TaxID=2584487 RepID=A0A4Y5TV16_9CAUD|nr:hypothetical protein HWC21_gp018 [Vibrio phage VAP7]QDB73200.1 hypothetical protein [Vibrio phage VAP7]UFD98115.1 hypothetical protein [Vibrio phage BX-1]